MSPETTQIATAAIAALVTISTLVFGWLKFRDERRFSGIERDLKDAIARADSLGKQVETLLINARVLERERDSLTFRVEMLTKQNTEQAAQIASLQQHEITCNAQLAHLRELLEQATRPKS